VELITILNFSADKESIGNAVRLLKGSAAVCSRCYLPAPRYDQFAERSFEFIARPKRVLRQRSNRRNPERPRPPVM
jgi:hypothetical protein